MPSTLLVSTWSSHYHSRESLARRLRRMLARDEQIRKPPPITLPRLAGHEKHAPAPTPAPTPTLTVPITTIIEAVAAFYGLPPDRVIRHRPSTQPRPRPMNVALYLVRTRSGASYKGAAAQLRIRAPNVVSAEFLRIAHERRIDPDLDRQIAAIETSLEGTCAGA